MCLVRHLLASVLHGLLNTVSLEHMLITLKLNIMVWIASYVCAVINLPPRSIELAGAVFKLSI